MAPSNMFSYLRPGHAKRNAEPLPVPLPSPTQHSEHFSSPRLSDNASYVSSSPISPFPPQLPPITRVASKLEAGRPATSSNGESAYDRGMLSPPQRRQAQPSPGWEKQTPARPMTASAPTGRRLPGVTLAQRAEQASLSETPAPPPTHLAPATISPSYSSFSRSQTSLMGGLGEKLSGASKGTSTPTAPAKAKSRLTLRNPMSLLMRRRSGQTLDPLSDDALVSHRAPADVPSMPDNFDPSIRGHIIHDFNAPRLNRNHSYGGEQTPQDLGRVSPQKIEREHTPVFREHFDDDTSYEQSQAAIRAEQLANKDFVTRNSLQAPPPRYSPPPPPLLPTHLPPAPPPPSYSPPSCPSFQGAENVSTVLSPVQEGSDPMDAAVEVTPRKRKSTKTPPPVRSRATSVTDPSFQPAGLPAHFTSRASRFSFQISGGADSAQEKILEERHKQKAAEKATREVRQSTIEDEYDDYGMDDYDMDDGLEEEIPMLGEEDDFGGLGDQSMDAGINEFDFSSLSIQSNFGDGLIPANPMGQLQTPVDANGIPIGFAMSAEMMQQFQLPSVGPHQNTPSGSHVDTIHPTSEDPLDQLGFEPSSSHAADDKRNSDNVYLDDEMYFDDGLIGEQEEEDAPFDESVFDDPTGPLYDRKVKSPSADELAHGPSSPPHEVISAEKGYDADDDTMSRHPEMSEPSLAHKPSVVQQQAVPTVDNMNAYHSALANAATRAEAAGRFARKASVDAGHVSSDVEDLSIYNARLGLVSEDVDSDVFPLEDDGFGMSSGFMDDYDYSDYESNLDDDPMIAAANAEALAFDDEGFYGQEFGFYASAVGESPNAWGGFFGPSGIGRTVSGRNAVREPNLTPITERSEYSTRNSFISLNHFRDSQQPLQSPGLAQLARMSPYGWPEDEDMSMDTLMKLRKGAFASLPGSSSNSPRNSSPIGMQFARLSSPAGNRFKEHNDSELESDESANIEDGYEGTEADDERFMDAVNAPYEDDTDSDASADERTAKSPTLTTSDYNSLSSPSRQVAQEASPLAGSFHTSHKAHPYVARALDHDGLGISSPLNIALPLSPFGMPLPSPGGVQQRPTAPPSIDTSLSSPSATVSNSTGPRRQSVGFASPISTSSPLTPNGSGWRGGHSRKGSAADSVTYVREHDEAGEGRWVLERRRTAESGELELVGRQVVEGGRI
jgi:hypothetical protein